MPSLRVILEQSMEWNSPFYEYVTVIDLWGGNRQRWQEMSLEVAKALQSTRKDYLPATFRTCDGLTCSVVHIGQLTDVFPVRTGMRRGCLVSSFCSPLRSTWLWNNPHHKKIKWNMMDIPVTTGRPGFCRWFASPVPHTTDATKDKYCCGTLNTSRTEYP